MLSFSTFLAESAVTDAAQRFLDYMNTKYPVELWRVTHIKSGKSVEINVPKDIKDNAGVSAERMKELYALNKGRRELGFHGATAKKNFTAERL